MSMRFQLGIVSGERTLQKPKFNANEKSHRPREASVDGPTRYSLLYEFGIGWFGGVNVSLPFYIIATHFEYIGSSLCL